jgi:hypothetical protein
MTDTLIADADGVYHPAVFNDRLVLGLKGTMAEVLSGHRHKTSYADFAVMPTMRWRRAVAGGGGRGRSA